MEISIRHERETDHRMVEELTRKAFWNLYVPGCNEHFLVHKMRPHPDFIEHLDLVATCDGTIIGNIMYTRSQLVNGRDERVQILTFGPLSVLPEYQRKGVGTALIGRSVEMATEAGFPAIVIYGNPGNYVRHGFISAKKLGIGLGDGRYPSCLLALELRPGALAKGQWQYLESEVYSIDAHEADLFDGNFELLEKGYRPSQEEFSILANSFLA